MKAIVMTFLLADVLLAGGAAIFTALTSTEHLPDY